MIAFHFVYSVECFVVLIELVCNRPQKVNNNAFVNKTIVNVIEINRLQIQFVKTQICAIAIFRLPLSICRCLTQFSSILIIATCRSQTEQFAAKYHNGNARISFMGGQYRTVLMKIFRRFSAHLPHKGEIKFDWKSIPKYFSQLALPSFLGQNEYAFRVFTSKYWHRVELLWWSLD